MPALVAMIDAKTEPPKKRGPYKPRQPKAKIVPEISK